VISSLPARTPALHAFLCGFYERSEDGAGVFIVIDGAFRVPLHRQHKVVRLGALERLDDSILRTSRYDA
jgi:hypothetical protein